MRKPDLPLSPESRRTALAIALAADFAQLALFPFFGWGALVPLNAAVDVAVCLMLTRLVGWHIAFLPCFILELTPVVTLVPSWTVAVMIATRTLSQSQPPARAPAPAERQGPIIDV